MSELIKRSDVIDMLRDRVPLKYFMGRDTDRAMRNMGELVSRVEEIPAVNPA